MIGTLGRKIVFEVSDDWVLTFNSMSREVSGRWAKHEVLGVKPKSEFLGPGCQAVNMTIHLSAALGVSRGGSWTRWSAWWKAVRRSTW